MSWKSVGGMKANTLNPQRQPLCYHLWTQNRRVEYPETATQAMFLNSDIDLAMRLVEGWSDSILDQNQKLKPFFLLTTHIKLYSLPWFITDHG